jgi:hypothetical protein
VVGPTPLLADLAGWLRAGDREWAGRAGDPVGGRGFETLEEAGRRQRVLIPVDDLQWANLSSQLLLRTVVGPFRRLLSRSC